LKAAPPCEKQALGEEVDAICQTTGFLAVAGHGVPDATISAAWTKAEAFFALAAKAQAERQGALPRLSLWLSRAGDGIARALARVEAPPDIKESFNGGPARVPSGLVDREALDFCFAPTIWPDAPNGFREAWSAYYAAMEDLAARIMRTFAVALDLPEDFFAPFLSAPVSALRALNYPALESPPKPGQIRAGAHTDYGSLTILLPQAGSRGLEILGPDGAWIEVFPRPGAFIVNIGDLMARWTNDRWTSTLHRVVIPDGGGAERRQSFAFFHQPNWDAEIVALDACLAIDEAPKYPPVRSGPYLMGKFKSTTM
jgi:isopenicillin N synthase-like dioxygenase